MLIDCFTFNNEFDLLEGRLEYLSDVVDYFVIVEGNITFSGIPREFHYVKQLERYSKYQDKILYFPFVVNCDGLNFDQKIDSFTPTAAAWVVEKAHRNHFMNALKLFSPDDYVIISDVDEIPSIAGINAAISHLTMDTPLISLHQKMFYYNFNKVQSAIWGGPIVSKLATVNEYTPEGIRAQRNNVPGITNGGWHLSCWMTPEEIQNKLKSFSHQEYNKEEYTDIEIIKSRMVSGVDVLGREINTFVDFDVESLPDDFKNVFLKYNKQW